MREYKCAAWLQILAPRTSSIMKTLPAPVSLGYDTRENGQENGNYYRDSIIRGYIEII